MQKLLVSGLALALCAPAFAQTKSFTSYDGYEKTEGTVYGYWLGRYDNHTHQMVDGEHKGTARVLTDIQHRRDSTFSATSYRNAGRSFTNLTISIGDADYDKLTSTFASNISKPTVVFNAAYSFPTLTGFPLIKNPAVWGGVKGEFTFKFAKIHLYSGKTDLGVQWDFKGGKLLNGGTWSTWGLSYYLDGEYVNTNSVYMRGTYTPTTRGTCNDSAITYTYGAYTYGYGYIYGKNGYVVNYRNKVFMASYGAYVAPGKPVIHAFGYPLNKGVNAGAKCNLLYINTLIPMYMVAFKTIEGNVAGSTGTYYHIFNWNPILSSLPVQLQGAWADSKTGQFALTQGVRMQFPKGPPPDKLPRRASIYWSGSKSTGRAYMNKGTDGYITPLTRFIHK